MPYPVAKWKAGWRDVVDIRVATKNMNSISIHRINFVWPTLINLHSVRNTIERNSLARIYHVIRKLRKYTNRTNWEKVVEHYIYLYLLCIQWNRSENQPTFSPVQILWQLHIVKTVTCIIIILHLCLLRFSFIHILPIKCIFDALASHISDCLWSCTFISRERDINEPTERKKIIVLKQMHMKLYRTTRTDLWAFVSMHLICVCMC